MDNYNSQQPDKNGSSQTYTLDQLREALLANDRFVREGLDIQLGGSILSLEFIGRNTESDSAGEEQEPATKKARRSIANDPDMGNIVIGEDSV
ncbi:hypothetical protein EG328_000379 [Venturia inaequalis]|uniref:Uncharacterized protein n=1 Tax=Venturia inaequalis TaxID=5025 RepID=A0A8H3U3K7_VENIN|nr:hypothetical protein EG328_000379 [Venturia inaequalis]